MLLVLLFKNPFQIHFKFCFDRCVVNDHFINVGGERDLTAAPTVVPHKLEPVSIGQVKSMLKNVNPNKSTNCEDWPAWIT